PRSILAPFVSAFRRSWRDLGMRCRHAEDALADVRQRAVRLLEREHDRDDAARNRGGEQRHGEPKDRCSKKGAMAFSCGLPPGFGDVRRRVHVLYSAGPTGFSRRATHAVALSAVRRCPSASRTPHSWLERFAEKGADSVLWVYSHAAIARASASSSRPRHAGM